MPYTYTLYKTDSMQTMLGATFLGQVRTEKSQEQAGNAEQVQAFSYAATP